jgi:hypothetical protein
MRRNKLTEPTIENEGRNRQSMATLSADEYEILVADIVRGMQQSAPEMAMLSLGSGRTNRVIGASGYSHQIDVSLVGPADIFLLECKKWRKRAGVESVLVLASRSNDIRQAQPNAVVRPILISSVGFTQGARKIAQHYGVRLEQVESPHAYGLQLGIRIRIAVSDNLVISDRVETYLYRDGKLIDG